MPQTSLKAQSVTGAQNQKKLSPSGWFFVGSDDAGESYRFAQCLGTITIRSTRSECFVTSEAPHLYRCGVLHYNTRNMKMKFGSEETIKMSKHGIDIGVYPLQRDDVDIVHVSTTEGHFQEFIHRTSTFVYYVIEGIGTFYLNGEAISVKKSDVIVAPPGTKIYYLGALEMILVTTPAWTEEGEIEIRKIEHISLSGRIEKSPSISAAY